MTKTQNTPTAEQRAAIESNHPFILCLAGPGAGKSSTLIGRIIRLIRDGAEPAGIVAICFTNQSAKVLADRLSEFSDEGTPISLAFTGTLHGFALHQLQRHGAPLGYGDRIAVLDQEQADEMLLSVAGEMGAKGGLKKFQEARESLRAGHKPRTPCEIAVAAYLKRLRAISACDFDTILTDFLALLRMDGHMAPGECSRRPGDMKYAGKLTLPPWDHLLVDELQDTAAIDAAIYLSMPAVNRFFVGDPDQSLYGFRGGRVENILELSRNPAVEVHLLEGNFRCGSAICEAANSLIGHNQNRVEKSTRAIREAVGKVFTLVPFKTDSEERWWAIEVIAQKLERGADPNEIAILSRGNALAHEMAKEAEARGIPVRKKKAVSMPADWAKARACLEYLNAPHSDLTSYQWLRAQHGHKGAEVYRQDAAKIQRPLWTVVPFQLTEIITPATYLPWLRRLGISRESVELIAEKAAGIPNPALASISYALARDLDSSPEEGHGVTITTLHASKGREFKTVFLVGMEDEIIPGHRKDTDEAEERRCLYVGITRAKDELYLSHCAQRKQTWGDQRLAPATPSCLLGELGL